MDLLSFCEEAIGTDNVVSIDNLLSSHT